MKTGFLFYCRPSTSWPVVYKSQERLEPSIMSKSDTMFNKRDRRCATVQHMLSTDPSYENRTIASTLKMQIRTVQRLKAQLNASDDPLEVVEWNVTSCHLTSSTSAWKSTPKCTWMCWRVWWSPGTIRWPVADPGCGSRSRRRPTSPKRPRLGFRGSAMTLYPSLTGPSSLHMNPLDYFLWSYVENVTNMTYHNTKASLITAICRIFAELPSALVEKACSHFRIHIKAVIEAGGGYIELMSSLQHNQVTWIFYSIKVLK